MSMEEPMVFEESTAGSTHQRKRSCFNQLKSGNIGGIIFAGIDASSSLIGMSFIIVGLVNIPVDGRMEVFAVRKLFITDAVLLTVQLFLTFMHYLAGLSKSFKVSVIWLLVSVPLLLAQLVVVVISVTIAGNIGLLLLVGAFCVSFVFKIPQIFTMLQFLVKSYQDNKKNHTSRDDLAKIRAAIGSVMGNSSS